MSADLAPHPSADDALSLLSERYRSLFDVRGVLGAGGNAVVLDAVQIDSGHRVALKVLHRRGAAANARLLAEFRSVRRISHRNLVQLFEMFDDGQHACFTMELVDGQDLLSWLQSDDGDPDQVWLRKVQAALLQLLDGLEELWRCGFAHGDVKPSNVRVQSDGRAVLLDFGLTRVTDLGAGSPHAHSVEGTLPYLAPELMTGGHPTSGTDLYALGVVLFRLLAQKWPHVADDLHHWFERKGQPAPVCHAQRSVPTAWCELATQLLHPEPTRRPAIALVRQVLTDGTVSRPPLTANPQWEQTLQSELPVATGPEPALRAREVIGRDVEMAQLRKVLTTPARRSLQVFTLVGRAGMGKTLLAELMCKEAADGTHALVLVGRCRHEEHIAFAGVEGLLQALARAIGELPAAEQLAVLPADVGALTVLFPWLAHQPGFANLVRPSEHQLRDESVWQRAQSVLIELLRRWGQRRPVVIWLDDVQWDDADGADLLRGLWQLPAPPPLLLFLGCRSEELAKSNLLGALAATDAALMPLQQVLELQPLTAADARALLAQTDCGDQPGIVASILPLAEGNPAWLLQLARIAAELEAHSTLGLPARLALHFEKMPAPQRNVLGCLAAAGRPLMVGELPLALPEHSQQVPVALSALENHGWIRLGAPNEAQLAWIDAPLVVDVVRALLTPAVVQQLHGRLLAGLRQRSDADGRHLLMHAVGAGELSGAGDLACELAQKAVSALAFHQAQWLFGMAAELGTGNLTAWDLHANWAQALLAAGRPSNAAERWMAAAEVAPLDAPELRQHLMLHAVAAHALAGKLFAAVAIVRKVVAAAQPHADASLIVRARRWLAGKNAGSTAPAAGTSSNRAGATASPCTDALATCGTLTVLAEPELLSQVLAAFVPTAAEPAGQAAALCWRAWQKLNEFGHTSNAVLDELAHSELLSHSAALGGEAASMPLSMVTARAMALFGGPAVTTLMLRSDGAGLAGHATSSSLDLPRAVDPLAHVGYTLMRAYAADALAQTGQLVELEQALTIDEQAAKRSGRVLSLALTLPASTFRYLWRDNLPAAQALVAQASAISFGPLLEHQLQAAMALVAAYAGDWTAAWQRLERFRYSAAATTALALPEESLRHWDLAARLALAAECAGHAGYGCTGSRNTNALPSALAALGRCRHPWAEPSARELHAAHLAQIGEVQAAATGLLRVARVWQTLGCQWRAELARAQACSLIAKGSALSTKAKPAPILAATQVGNPTRWAATLLPMPK